MGQFIIYRDLLHLYDPNRKLYVAVSDTIYDDFFQPRGVQYIVNQNALALIVVDLENEVIVEWTNTTNTGI